MLISIWKNIKLVVKIVSIAKMIIKLVIINDFHMFRT